MSGSEDDYDFSEINEDSLIIVEEEISDHEEPMEDIPEDHTNIFSGHSNEIYCLAVAQGVGLAVTGAADDCAIVWHIHDCTVKFRCEGHIDSVVSADFHEGGNVLFTADMLGKIQLWKVENGRLVCSFNVSETLLWCIWVPRQQELLAGSTDGTVWVLDPKNQQSRCLPFVSSSCVVALPLISTNETQKMALGYDDGLVTVYDFPSGLLYSKYSQFLGGDPVVTLACHENGQLLAVGYESGTVRFLLLPDKVLKEYQIEGLGDLAVEGLEFVKINGLDLLICAATSGHVVCFDIVRSIIRYKLGLEYFLTKLVIFRDCCFLSTSCGHICMLACTTGDQIRTFYIHNDAITDFKVVNGANGGLGIVSCSLDSTSKIILV